MTSATLLRRSSVVLAAFTMACGDATGLSNLSEQQVGDMLDAMSSVAYYGEVPGASLNMAGLRLAPQTANATVSVSQNVTCPNGGSAGVTGTATDDEAGNASALITQTFSGCAATSSEGRVWTFDGTPNIVTDMTATYNETTGAFSITVTQVGGIRASSNLGSGNCAIDLTLTMSGDENSFSYSIDGSACGRDIQQSIEYTN
jgi:hypothetical protein